MEPSPRSGRVFHDERRSLLVTALEVRSDMEMLALKLGYSWGTRFPGGFVTHVQRLGLLVKGVTRGLLSMILLSLMTALWVSGEAVSAAERMCGYQVSMASS